MAAAARPHNGARAVPLLRLLPVLLSAGTAHSPAALPPCALSFTPFSGCPRPSRLPRRKWIVLLSGEAEGGRGKCFRGNGPRVGVCKLASVPAGTAVATGLARRAGAWRRRRAAGETVEGRAWQVCETDVNFIQGIQLENQDWQTLFLQTIGRNQAETRDSWNIYLPFGGH